MNWGGVIAASMAGQAFKGAMEERSRIKTERGFIEQAGQMFMDLGTDESRQFAQQLMQEPKAAMMRAEAFGGFEKMYTGMRERAARRKLAQTLQSFSEEAGNRPITRREILGELLPAMINSDIPNAVGMAQTLLSGATTGNAPPKWFTDRIRPEDWTPESYRKALQYGMSTGDWEKGAVDSLVPRPRKDPRDLTPSAEKTQKELIILNKNQKAMEDVARGAPVESIEFVSEAEAAWLNAARRQANPLDFNKFEPYRPPVGYKGGSGKKEAEDVTPDIDRPLVPSEEQSGDAKGYLGSLFEDVVSQWWK